MSVSSGIRVRPHRIKVFYQYQQLTKLFDGAQSGKVIALYLLDEMELRRILFALTCLEHLVRRPMHDLFKSTPCEISFYGTCLKWRRRHAASHNFSTVIL